MMVKLVDLWAGGSEVFAGYKFIGDTYNWSLVAIDYVNKRVLARYPNGKLYELKMKNNRRFKFE